MDGIITKGIGGFYYVKTADKREYECKARGIFRKAHIVPTIGDRVRLESLSDGKGAITEIYKRSSYLNRPPVANVDAMVLVAAAASPEPNIFLLDKMLVNAEISGIRPILCINKTDLCERSDIENIYRTAGYEVIKASAQCGTGIEELRSVLKGRVTAFAGLSGVGKSSLLSLITNKSIETGAVSEKISRGRHTTRHVELFELDNGFVLDTPGFSSLEIEGIRADELYRYFPEMSEANGECRFRGCSHINEPDCAVKALIKSGKLAQSRYDSYAEIYGKLKLVKEWETK